MIDTDFLHVLRKRELELVLHYMQPGLKVLEFGAGSGAQALELKKVGFNVVAIDLPESDYVNLRVMPITEYDGHRIPLESNSIDIVFSSNVLEHVENFAEIQKEFHRILRQDGYCVHLMPSVAWRAWTFASGIPNSMIAAVRTVREIVSPVRGTRPQALLRNMKTVVGGVLPLGHGTSIEGISELWTFSVAAWRSRFRKAGFRVVLARPVGVFHTGHMLFGKRLSINARERLARRIGSAASVFVVRPDERSLHEQEE